MGQRGGHGLDISRAQVRDGEELYKVRAGIMGHHDLRRCQGAGDGYQTQLLGFTDDRGIRIGGDDELSAGVGSEGNLLGCQNRTGTHGHGIAKVFLQQPDPVGSLSIGDDTLGIKGHFHHADTAVIQCMGKGQQLRPFHTTDDDNYFMFQNFCNCFIHSIHLLYYWRMLEVI